MLLKSGARGVLTLGLLLALGSQAARPAGAAGPYTVNSLIDVIDATPGNGVCEISAGSGLCTLRAAVMEANASAGLDTIILPSGTYTLTLIGDDNTALAGDLDLTDPVQLQGAGQGSTIIAASSPISDRVMHVWFTEAWVSGVTIRGGDVDTSSGGGIFSGGSLTLTASTVRDNHSGYGGAIYHGSSTGRLVLIDTTLIANTTNHGGGLMMYDGQAWLTRTVVTGNTAVLGGGVYLFDDAQVWVSQSSILTNTATNGGGIYVTDGEVTVTESAVRGNRATHNGGGIANEDRAMVVNSTINLNEADAWGGGVYNVTASVTSLYNTTVAHNLADDDADTVGQGGGVAQVGGTVVVRHALIANNGNTQQFTTPFKDDCWGALTSGGYNLVEETNNCVLISILTGNILETDPQLGALRSHLGRPPAYGLLPGSPALEAGNPYGGCYDANNLLTTDQRGLPRHADGDRDGQAVCDIGAFEVQLLTYAPLIVR